MKMAFNMEEKQHLCDFKNQKYTFKSSSSETGQRDVIGCQ